MFIASLYYLAWHATNWDLILSECRSVHKSDPLSKMEAFHSVLCKIASCSFSHNDQLSLWNEVGVEEWSLKMVQFLERTSVMVLCWSQVEGGGGPLRPHQARWRVAVRGPASVIEADCLSYGGCAPWENLREQGQRLDAHVICVAYSYFLLLYLFIKSHHHYI